MGLLDKFFGGKKTADPRKDVLRADAPPATIRVYDKFGRQMEILRKDWLQSVFLPALEKERGNPDALYQHIAQGLQDGFAQEVLPFAKHLESSDSNPGRGAILHGAALLQLQEFAKARDVLEAARQRLGEDGYLETNIAKAYAGLGLNDQAEAILWHALELDPNQENALDWYIAIQRERHGDTGANEAYTRAAGLPGSWRPQLWQARAALAAGDMEAARTLHEGVLARFTEVPADVLMQISGDLGNAGQLIPLITLCAPRFSVQLHGLQTGNNLLKAYIESGQTLEARKLLELLYSQQRPDWQETLVYWEKELNKAENRFGPMPADAKFEVGLLTLPEPVWMRSRLGFDRFLPTRPEDAPHILVLCGSGTKGHEGESVVRSQPADELGRVTRGLPLLIAEELLLRTRARVTYVLPWFSEGGFVLCERPWNASEMPLDGLSATWVLTTHIDAQQEPWRATLRAERSGTAEVIREWRLDIPQSNPSDAIAHCVSAVIQHVGLPQATPSFALPPTRWLAHYLSTLEQALAVCAAQMAEGKNHFLHFERSIFDGMFQLAVELPTNVRVRMILLSALEREQRLRPDVVAEYREKLLLLQEQHPIPDQRVAEAISHAVRFLLEGHAVH